MSVRSTLRPYDRAVRPVLDDPDPRWAGQARALLDALADAAADAGLAEVDLQHIGSTSVPGLPAKPFLDLQLRLATLQADDVLDAVVGVAGFRPTEGSNPDSPGVRRDSPRGGEDVPDDVWRKRLYLAHDPDAVLHVRLAASPWGRHTVAFRDWLRAHPCEVERYAATKRRLSAQFAGDDHPDGYTRAKTAYFDEVHAAFTAWASRG